MWDGCVAVGGAPVERSRCSGERELLGRLRRLGIGEAPHPEPVQQPEQAGDDGNEQGYLKRAIAGAFVDAEDLVLYGSRFAGQEWLELGVAHHLGVVLQCVRDLLLLSRWYYLALLGLV